MARATSRLFENHKQIFLRVLNGEQTLRVRATTAYERKISRIRMSFGTFFLFFGNNIERGKYVYLSAASDKIKNASPDITLVFYFENLRLCRIQFHSGGSILKFLPRN